MKYILATLSITLFLVSCNSEKRDKQQVESILHSEKYDKYKKRIACIQYITKHKDDRIYAKSLVKKLLSAGSYTEAIFTVEMLLEKFPQDPELFFLLGVGYRNLHQYSLAIENVDHALRMEQENRLFSKEAQTLKEEEKVWNEILSLNRTLINTTDSFDVLLNRAVKFFSIQQYDAVIFDLGALSKLGSKDDSLYFTQMLSSLYQEKGRKSIEILSNMLRYYQSPETKEIQLK
jgi:tetratricopeptide (TPR) repeat protein